MTTKQIWEYVTTIVKDDLMGYVNPEEVSRLFNIKQILRFNELIPVIERSLSEQHSLSPFTRSAQFPVVNGFCNLNTKNDFYYGPLRTGVFASYKCGEGESQSMKRNPVSWLTDSEWYEATISVIQQPDEEFPAACFGAPASESSPKGWIQVLPKSISLIDLKYLVKPKDIYIAGTYSGGIFFPDPNDPSNVDPEWFDQDVYRIIGATLADIGVPLDDQAVREAGFIMKEDKG